MTGIVFQLTSSRRGWLAPEARYLQVLHISTHILTKRMTILPFNCFLVKEYFNSHPHEEDDNGEHIKYYAYNISTHILTKRMTQLLEVFKPSIVISTHILTKRMTEIAEGVCSKGIFQLTSSRRGWRAKSPQFQLSISFQLTSSRRGWQADNREKQSSRLISTHILTKRMTEIWETNLAVA